MKKILPNSFFEFNFILFPFFLIPLYYLFKSNLSAELVFLIFLVLFGETHFASSFLFFNKENANYIKKNFIVLIIIPFFLCICYFIFSLYFFKIAVFFGAVASGIHVTRQSIGISRLYKESINFNYELLIYFSSLTFLLIGFLRFYYEKFEFFKEIFIFDLIYKYFNIASSFNLSFILLVLFLITIGFLENANIKKRITNVTAILIYTPYLFVDHIYDAIIIGVGAHWLQYLALNYKIYFYKKNYNFSLFIKIFFILLYSITMSLLGYKYHFSKDILEFLIAIPLTLQFFHYYIDAFIWRFSVKEIRQNIGSKLFAA